MKNIQSCTIYTNEKKLENTTEYDKIDLITDDKKR